MGNRRALGLSYEDAHSRRLPLKPWIFGLSQNGYITYDEVVRRTAHVHYRTGNGSPQGEPYLMPRGAGRHRHPRRRGTHTTGYAGNMFPNVRRPASVSTCNAYVCDDAWVILRHPTDYSPCTLLYTNASSTRLMNLLTAVTDTRIGKSPNRRIRANNSNHPR